MRIFVFEFITGGGWFDIDPVAATSSSLLNEGRAMVEALAEDFTAIPGAAVSALIDARLRIDFPIGCETVAVGGADEFASAFDRLAGLADFTLLIAPEFDGHLHRAANEVMLARGELLSPSTDFIRLASDKQLTAERLREQNVSAPNGIALSANQSPPPDFPYPAVLKPRDGAGSIGIRYIADADAAREEAPLATPARLEQYHPGVPASVAALCGPNGTTLLPPCSQFISCDGRFTYHGGSCPLPATFANRATQLAEKTLNAFPATLGYVGMDLILGHDAAGKADVVIEVNPRLTTSYIGLRAIMRENLAEAMLRVARGEHVELSARPGRVEFSAGGEVQYYNE